jgi:hypothetical protein
MQPIVVPAGTTVAAGANEGARERPLSNKGLGNAMKDLAKKLGNGGCGNDSGFPPPDARLARKKKPGPKEPGLRFWPREADTITFQEGLLNVRATGGGGQMRDADTQRTNSMIPVGALRKPSGSHVSHAVSEGYRMIIKTASAAPC